MILFAYDVVKKQKQILYKILPSVNSNIFEDIFKLRTVSQASPHSEIILIGGDGVQSSRLCYIYYLPISCKTQNYKLTINGHEWYVSSFDGFEFFLTYNRVG